MKATQRQALLAILALALLLRLSHFWFALHGPLAFQTGPDEDYYLRFGRDVAGGMSGMTPEFAFMDPLYGYLLGAVIAVTGNEFGMFLLQMLLDTATAGCLFLIGRELGRPRIGLLAAAIYGLLLGPALAFGTMLLKATCVAAYLTWWIWFALRISTDRRANRWILFGVYCGMGVALRANLVLLAPLALLAIFASRVPRPLAASAGLLLGLALPLALLSARNIAIDGRASPFPSNGGVVLHQLYNPGNPESLSGPPSFPPFVRYRHPSEVWKGYRREADRIAGHALEAAASEGFWRAQALDYMLNHPMQALGNSLRKLGEASASVEIPNNRSYRDEQLFSPVLQWMPPPFAFLFALGVPGLLQLVRQDRRSLWLLVPVAMSVATMAVFFAEDRFRFGTVPMLVLGSATWLGWLCWRLREGRYMLLMLGTLVSLLLAGISLWQGWRFPMPETDWARIANGYIRIGEPRRASEWVAFAAKRYPTDPRIAELQGLLALERGDFVQARERLETALAQRPDRHEVWHNYSVALERQGELERALAAEAQAAELSPVPDYWFRMGLLLEQLGRQREAGQLYYRVITHQDTPMGLVKLAKSSLQRLPISRSAASEKR